MAAYIYLKSIAKNNKDKVIIADLNLGLEKGHTLAIIGKNNSGKSMLLKIIRSLKDHSMELYLEIAINFFRKPDGNQKIIWNH